MKNGIGVKIGLTLIAISGYVSAESSFEVRSLAASCAACHGTYGIAQQGMESLAGQTKEDLLKKMLGFKAGKVPATLMHQLASGYSDEQLEQLAGYFAALKK
jgi:cytochrome c553